MPSALQEPRESRADFDFIIDLVYARTRIRLHDGKHCLIRSRLGKRMRHLGMATLGEYCALLRSPEGEEEVVNAIDALTTNFTRFLREVQHFNFMVEEALPALGCRPGRRFEVWSAACATGEEPYTLAMFLSERYPPPGGWDWRVTASDISTKALANAAEGIYTADHLGDVKDGWLRRYFQRGVGQWEGWFRIKPSLAERVRFLQVNLLGQYPFDRPFEVIFCRNVMIYFDRPTQLELVRSLERMLVPGGYLVVGHSESLNGLRVPLRCLRPSIYCKG